MCVMRDMLCGEREEERCVSLDLSKMKALEKRIFFCEKRLLLSSLSLSHILSSRDTPYCSAGFLWPVLEELKINLPKHAEEKEKRERN